MPHAMLAAETNSLRIADRRIGQALAAMFGEEDSPPRPASE
jgi:hypothetical protein